MYLRSRTDINRWTLCVFVLNRVLFVSMSSWSFYAAIMRRITERPCQHFFIPATKSHLDLHIVPKCVIITIKSHSNVRKCTGRELISTEDLAVLYGNDFDCSFFFSFCMCVFRWCCASFMVHLLQATASLHLRNLVTLLWLILLVIKWISERKEHGSEGIIYDFRCCLGAPLHTNLQ